MPDRINIRVDHLKNLYQLHDITFDVLRLDLIHPVISGNKWFKLKEYLRLAKAENKKNILTFGGAWSNHIAATAAICTQEGFNAIGIIRGERAKVLSCTLQLAELMKMKLYFINKTDYRNKYIPPIIWETFKKEETFIINEGGYGLPGKQGAMDILSGTAKDYSHILLSAGTGTTLAGIATAASTQKIIGISTLKNHFGLAKDINALMPEQLQNRFIILDNYHWGGYAKYNSQLIGFMNQWFLKTGIPTDFVYTAKLFYAVDDLIKMNYFPKSSRLLCIHSGGLQGNLSLPKGTLIF